MATVTLDLDDPSNQTYIDEKGYRVERVAIVTGVTPGSNDSVVYDAINDVAMPDIGDAHPTITDIYLTKITGVALDSQTARCILSYGEKDQGSETTSSNATAYANASTVSEEITTDKNGAEMSTVYTVINNLASWTVTNETFTATVERARITFDFEYTSTTFPQTDINTYLGKINSAIWNGYAVNTILCTAINVTQSGDDYRIRYSFAYNADTWTFFAKISEPVGNISGSTDTDLDQTTGIKEFDVYDSVSFAPLGFTL